MTDASSDPLPDTLRVLLVEDDPPTRQLVLAMLPDRWNCDVVSSAPEARAAMRREDYDVALIDIRLDAPGGEPESGVELFEQMDEDGYWTGASAIAVTAYAMPGDRERLLEAGFEGYVAKPFAKDQLLGAIAEAVE